MSTNSPNKGYILPAVGDFVDTWGIQLDSNVFSIADLNLGGRLAKTVAGSTIVLNSTETRNVYVNVSGTISANVNLEFPATAGGFWMVRNGSSGAFTLTAKPTGGTGVVLPQGGESLIFVDPDNTRAVFGAAPNVLTTRGDIMSRDSSTYRRIALGSANTFFVSSGTDPGWLDATNSRTAMGLGTAAVKNTGTSGNNVPLLDGANTWSASQAVILTGSASFGISGTTRAGLSLSADAATDRSIDYNTVGIARWKLVTNNEAESGANAGSSFSINAYDDAGSLLSSPISIVRATGITTIRQLLLTTALAVAQGGTGAVSAANARTNLGVTATGSDTTYCYRANNLSDVTASTARTNLGLAIGSNVQAWSTRLDAIAALAVTDGNFIVGNGSTWVVESGSTVRTSLGLGTAAVATTGTSGHTVPFLDGANTWSAAQSFAAYSYYGLFNAGGDYPANNVALSVGWNFSSGDREVTFWNCDTGNSTGKAFELRQLTGASSSTLVASWNVDGTMTLGAAGNIVYRAGGTDVAIADGGTGQSTAIAGARALLNGLGTTKGQIIWYNGTNWVALEPP